MKKLLSLLLIICSIGVAYADDKSTVTSLKYVTDELNTRQDKFGANDGKAMTFTNVAGGNAPRDVKSSLGSNTSDNGLPTVAAVNAGLDDKQDTIPAVNTNTVVTYTGTPGTLGQKGIYQDTGTYATQSDNLIDAGTFNEALKTGLDSEFICADTDPVSGNCWLWTIHNDDTSANLFDKNNLTRIYGYFPSSGSAWTYTGNAYSVRIPCQPNTKYTARYNGNSSQVVLSFASTSSDSVPSTTLASVPCTNSIRQNNPTINTPITITTGPSDKWLVVAYNVAEPQNSDMANNLQIEQGETATSYQAPTPYTTLVPTGYTPVEYIEGTGTQWIDTGVSGLNTGDWEIYTKWMITGKPSGAYPYICGIYSNEQTNAYRILLKQQETDAYYVSGNSRAGGGSLLITNVPQNVVHYGIIRNGSVTLDGITYLTTVQGDSVPSGSRIGLFSYGANSVKIKGRIYAAYATKDNVMQYDYVPARRNSDNAIGMYDTVSGTFKENAGTGTFTAGPDVSNVVYIPQGQN